MNSEQIAELKGLPARLYASGIASRADAGLVQAAYDALVAAAAPAAPAGPVTGPTPEKTTIVAELNVMVNHEIVSVIGFLLDVAQAAHLAMQDCEDCGDHYKVQREDFDALNAAMEKLEALPDDRPGYTLSGPGKAEWALRDRGESIIDGSRPDDTRAATAADLPPAVPTVEIFHRGRVERYTPNRNYYNEEQMRAALAATAAPVAEPSVTPETQAKVDEIAATAHRASERVAALREKYGIAAQPQPVAEQGGLPKWMDDQKGKDPLMDDMINYIEGMHADLARVYDAFGIGSQARKIGTLMGNLENVIRFAEMLHAVEREFFMVPGEPDEDYPDEQPDDECMVNCWGSTLQQYVEQFRKALPRAAIAASQQAAEPMTLQQVADRLNETTVLSGQAWRNFLNGDPLTIAPSDVVQIANYFAAPAIQQPQDEHAAYVAWVDTMQPEAAPHLTAWNGWQARAALAKKGASHG